ncbi:hypothetical protein MHK_009640 [Candidatus Magnetomorum sp. HK-1]|nr:hypothetical protein MHK_009640 [Candidatus Magnetomorum sp. HK-1]
MDVYNKLFNSFAICINNTEYPSSLELHKVYPVLPDNDALQDGDIRIIDESGEDYLYPSNYFISFNLSYETETVLANSFSQYYRIMRTTYRA